MNLLNLFCDVDDFCKSYVARYRQALLTDGKQTRNRKGHLELSEMMTILIYFHQSQGFRNFKGYYNLFIRQFQKQAFPNAVSYSRFIDLIPKAFCPLIVYFSTRKGKTTGIAFIDSTPLKVCHNLRIGSHKVFRNIARRGKTSTGWFYGLKLHLIINERGEILGVRVTPGNTDDRSPVEAMSNGLFGKLFGDKGYISKRLFEELALKGIEMITKTKKNMKKRLLSLFDRILLRKRALIETVNDQLKNVCYIEHTRHRSPLNAMVHLIGGLIAYTWQSQKPGINLTKEEVEILNKFRVNNKMIAF